jgi:integrase/recombinase XerC
MITENFIHYLQYEKRYSPHTIKAYQSDLRDFFTFIDITYATTAIDEIQYQMIRSWIVHLMNSTVTSRSVNRKLSTLKTFFKFLRQENLIRVNPMLKILPPKTSKKLPVFVNSENMEMLFDKVDFGNDFVAIRDKLIIELFYHTGIRLSELLNLRDNDIDLSGLRLKVLGKRNKERILPFAKGLGESMRGYLNIRNNLISALEPNSFFFVRENGKKMYGELVYRIVNQYLNKVSTLQKKSPHVLRHTFATHMLNNGADLNAIKELLGHSNLAATQVYTHNTIGKLKTVYKLAHPRA